MLYAYIFTHQDTVKIRSVMPCTDYDAEETLDISGKTKLQFAEKPDYQAGDFIILKEESDVVYSGVIADGSGVKSSDAYTLNAVQMEMIFDRKLFSDNESLIKTTGIEDFIKYTIEHEFSASDDAMLNMTFISATVSTHTKIQASIGSIITMSEDAYNFKTFIGNCCEYYGIFLKFSITGDGKLYITIEKKDQGSYILDTTVSDVLDYTEKYSQTVVAKVKVKETTTGTTGTWYLKNDRTTTKDATDSNRAAGDATVTECETTDEMEQKAIDTFKSNSYQHSLSMKLRNDSQMYDVSELYLGRKFTVYTQSHGTYETFVDKLKRDKDSGFCTITCGSLPVTLIEKLREALK